MAGAQALLQLDTHTLGLLKTWGGAAAALVLLAYPCWLYRRYKSSHFEGWTRYV